MMSAVRMSVATVARRGRIASVMGILTPAVDGAGCCVLQTRPGEPFAALLGRAAVGRGCSHHLLCDRLSCVTYGPPCTPVPDPDTRARADQTLGRRQRTHGAGEGTDGGSVGRSGHPTGGRRHAATVP